MKFLHISDLHLGKSISAVSMLDEQRAMLSQVLSMVREHKPDGVLIAGDVFDRANPSAEALSLFDDFLVSLIQLPSRTEVFVISGNHDGPERIAYGSRILDRSGLHMSPLYDGHIRPFTMTDEYGELDVFMLPFLKIGTVRYYFPDETIESESDAIACAVSHMEGFDKTRRTVCLAHQFVSGASFSGSEETNIGGLDCVSADVFDGIDYVALGHIHGHQNIRKGIRYSGSPLKYSFSEVSHHKSASLVEVREKGDVSVTELPIVPLHDWYDVRGTFNDLTSEAFLQAHPEYREGYLRVTLTDENDVIDGFRSLRAVYRNMMELNYDNARLRALGVISSEGTEEMSDEELICSLFKKQNGRDVNDKESAFIKEILKEIEG